MVPQRLGVREVTALVKRCIEDSLAPLWVEGEVSNFVAHGSGHFYFSLKDPDAQLRCVMFRRANQRLRFRPEDGAKVAAFGQITVYPPSGQYQLIVERMLALGEGDLRAAFEALKRRLAEEGLFDAAHKRPLPAYPRRVGVVTSPTGAAIRDIVHVLRRRWPAIEITLRPVRVQGEGAAAEIAGGIRDMCRYSESDVLIVGRGGGSLEDLWAFNEEEVARAIFAATVPVISAVGHEIDTTIADFVADVRAPTPSAAAELAVRDREDVLRGAGQWVRHSGQQVARRLAEMRLRVEAARRGRALQSPLDRLRQESQRADELFDRATRALRSRVAQLRDRTRHMEAQIEALSPAGVLDRGYALAYDAAGRILRSAADARPGDRLRVRLARGALRCEVIDREEERDG